MAFEIDGTGRTTGRGTVSLDGVPFSYGTPVVGRVTTPTNTATSASGGRTLSYGSGVPTIGGVGSTPVSYQTGAATPQFGNAGFLSNFLATASSAATAVTNTARNYGSAPSGYADTSGVPQSSISEVSTVNVDGGSDFLSRLGGLTSAIQSLSGGGDSVGQPQATVVPVLGSNGSQAASGINPLYVVGAALAVGGLYFMTAR